MSEELDLFSGGLVPQYVPSFDEWYARYPRKQGKAPARKRWAKMSAPEKASAWLALDGWERYAAVDGTTYVPYASTWLNQCRWEDEAPVPTRNQPKPNTPMGFLAAIAERDHQ